MPSSDHRDSHPPPRDDNRRLVVFMVLVVALFLGVVVVALSRSTSRLQVGGVTVSLLPYYSLACSLTEGTTIPVQLVIPPGASPHTHALRPSEVELVHASQLLLADGLHDGPVLRVAAAGGPRVVPLALAVEVQEALPPAFRTEEAGEHEHGEGDHEHHGERAPVHAWLDPAAAPALCRAMARALQEAYPEHRAHLEQRARELESRLVALHAELERQAASVRGRPFLVLHSAFAVLAERYQLDLVASVQDEDGRAPTPARLATLQELRRSRGLVALFGEPQLEDQGARVLAEELGLPFHELDPLGQVLRGAGGYEHLLREAMQTIVIALEPR